MTACIRCYNKKSALLSYISAFLILVLLCHSREVSEGVYSGALFAVKCLVPTLFPFFIISDMILSFGLPFDNFLKKRGLYVIIIGLICGFPHGARCATKLFRDGSIGTHEYETLLILSNCPSIAFVVSGIGSGMLGSSTYGLILFIALILSVIILSFIRRLGDVALVKSLDIQSGSFNLVESIKSAGASSLTVASFIIFFYGINALISHFLNAGFLSQIVAILLEIGTGSASVASDASLPLIQKMTLLGFTVGFSSLSVFMQCSAFISEEIKRKKLLTFKLVQGVLCALFAFLLTFIYEKWLF